MTDSCVSGVWVGHLPPSVLERPVLPPLTQFVRSGHWWVGARRPNSASYVNPAQPLESRPALFVRPLLCSPARSKVPSPAGIDVCVLARPPPRSLFMTLPQVARALRAEEWEWMEEAKERLLKYEAIFNGPCVQFHPTYAYGTAAALGQRPLTARTAAYWEIRVPVVYGTSIMFGVGSRRSPMRFDTRFEDLIGSKGTVSYGISHKGQLHWDGRTRPYCAPFSERKQAVVGCHFDGPKRQISFFLNGESLGVAFDNVDLNEPLYPMVSSTAQKSTFIIQNQHARDIYPTLRDMCINVVSRKLCGTTQLDSLGLPTPVKNDVVNEMLYLGTLFNANPKQNSESNSPSTKPKKRKWPIEFDLQDLTSSDCAFLGIAYESYTQQPWAVSITSV